MGEPEKEAGIAMRGMGALFAGLVVLLAVTALTVYMVHAYLVAQQSLREQQMLYEKARYIAEHANMTGNTVNLPEPADLIVIDPDGIPHVAKDVKQIQLPWSSAKTKIYVAVTGHLRVAASDPMARAAALASVAAAPLQPPGNTSGIAGCEWYLDPFIYNITKNAAEYRGYILYKEMPQIGYFFYTGPKDLCKTEPSWYPLWEYPLGILEALGINTTRLLSNCPDIYVTDIAIVPYIGVVVRGIPPSMVYNYIDYGDFYLIFYNGTWREIGSGIYWNYSIQIGNTRIVIEKVYLNPRFAPIGDWKVFINVSSPIISVNYSRTETLIPDQNELWISARLGTGLILAAEKWYTYYFAETYKGFPAAPTIVHKLNAYAKGPNYTYYLQAIALLRRGAVPIPPAPRSIAYIYRHC